MLSGFASEVVCKGWRAFAAAAVCALLALSFASAAQAATVEPVEIITRNGVRVFDVEIANTEQERMQGLMYRKTVPEGTGMLFDFGEPHIVTMWMKNTYVSLDMIFIRANGTIARIAEHTTPLSEAHIGSGSPVKAVLEVAAGTARKYGIAVGDKVAHRFFNGR